jgi:predicted O-methyltransferase YrrM
VNPVLKEILASGQVTDGVETFPLHSNMDEREGNLLSAVLKSVQPSTSLEVGFAYGISTLFICDQLARLGRPARHIVLDPFQHSEWKGIGLRNVERAGYAGFVELHEERSEIALPRLLSEQVVLDMAIIDGWHTFDHTLVDFFYINKMLRVGGVVLIDDTSYPSIGRVIDHILTYPCYRIFAIPFRPLPLVSLGCPLFAWRLAYYLGLRKSRWPSAIALQKTAPDERSWSWHKPF